MGRSNTTPGPARSFSPPAAPESEGSPPIALPGHPITWPVPRPESRPPPAARRTLSRRRPWGHPRAGRALRLVAGALALLCAIGGALTAYAALTLPSLDGLGRAAGTIRILDRDGAVVSEIGHDQRTRTTVPLEQIAPIMQAATIAAEDRSFYSEGAVNYTRVLHALVVDVLAGSPAQGASTITQQLAKLAFLSPDRSPLRKLREALLANQIGERYTKQQILELYLNLVDYGEGAYGVEDASERYFGVHASQLSVQEASLLAGLPEAPADNDPYTSPQTAFGRQHYVLGGLVATGTITADQAAALDPLASDAATRDRNQATMRLALAAGHPQPRMAAPHFVGYVLGELDALFADRPELLQGSLDVQTSLDSAAQRSAENAVARGVAAIGKGANNGALLMLEPGTGNIRALVGSADFGNDAIAGQYDVALGQRRPGSTFKPIVYATAFAEGRLSPGSMLDDTAAESARLGGARDYDGAYPGRMSVRDALLGSRNIPAEQAMEIAGVDQVIATAHRLGITTDLAANATTAIGTSAVRMVDLAAVYGALADGGAREQPHAVLRVADANGTVLYEAGSGQTGDRVLDTAVTDQVTGILRDYPAHWGIAFDRPVAAKSGTTDGYVDGWYVAYTPNWVVASWVGHTDGASVEEVGMNGVGGNDVGANITAPFVASLPARDDGFGPSAAPPQTPAQQCQGKHCGGGGG
jgi:membrane peptidoglycan carboxypeptidase